MPSSRAFLNTCMDGDLRTAISEAVRAARAINEEIRSADSVQPVQEASAKEQPAEQVIAFEPIPSAEAFGRGSVTQHATTAFVSWAHAHPDWGAVETAEWERKVAKFVATLRTSGGIDADVDLYHAADPDIDWTRYGPNRIELDEFVLIAMSEAWADRWSGKNKPTVGAGAVGEADALHGLFAKHQADWQRRINIVMFPGVPDAVIPIDLARVSRFYVDPDDLDTYDSLLRSLTAQPRYVPPPLGSVPSLSAADLRSTGRTRAKQSRRAAAEQESIQERLAELDATIARVAAGSQEALDLASLRVALQSLLDAMYE
jgi:hypothetical protein